MTDHRKYQHVVTLGFEGEPDYDKLYALDGVVLEERVQSRRPWKRRLRGRLRRFRYRLEYACRRMGRRVRRRLRT